MRTLLCLLAVAAGGCSVSGTVEAEIEAALPAALGPADSYDAVVEGVRVGDGTARRVTVVGLRVAREDAPVIDRLDVELREVAFDRRARRITDVGSARATVRLLAPDVSGYLAGQRGVGAADVTFQEPDRATVRVRGEVGDVTVPATATLEGQLVAQDGRVRLDVESVRALGVGLGDRVSRLVAAEVNPVVDLTDEDVALRVTSVRVEGGELVLEATGDLRGVRLGP